VCEVVDNSVGDALRGIRGYRGSGSGLTLAPTETVDMAR
jgi:hypothetical protein